jgi:nitrite reductase/ring-hydroxylating ferredoxin subunit
MKRDPLWREEISIFSADEKYVNRRQFAKFLVLTSAGMFVGNLWILVKSWLTKTPVYPLRSIAKLSEIPVGGSKLFTYPTAADPCILVRTGETELAAFSQKCTHLSCAVYYQRESNRFECPCHQGYFAAKDGRVLQGPPQRPLPRILLQQKGDELFAVGVDLGEA